MITEAPFDVVYRLVEVNHFLGIIEEVDLVVAWDQVRETHAHEPDQHAPVVELRKEFFDLLQEHVIGAGVGNAGLFGDGIEVGIAQFHRNATRELVLLPEFKGDLFGHPHQFVIQEGHVGGVGLEGVFGGDALLFAIGNDGTLVYAVGPSPEFYTVLSKEVTEHFHGYFRKHPDGLHAHLPEQFRGLFAYHGQLLYGQGSQEYLFFSEGNFHLPVGLGFIRADFADELVGGQGIRNGKPGFFGDIVPEFGGEPGYAEEAVHARHVYVKLIDAGLFIDRNFGLDDFRDGMGVLRIAFHVSAYDDSLGAKAFGQLNGHGAVYAKGPGLVAAGSDDASFPSAYDQWSSF